MTLVVSSWLIMDLQIHTAAKTVLSVPKMYQLLTTTKNEPPTRVKNDQKVSFDIILKPKPGCNLEKEALSINTPGSSDFKHFLTPTEIGMKFGAPKATIDQWQRLLRRYSLKAIPLKNRLMIRVFGRVNKIDHLFRTNLNTACYHQNVVQFGDQLPHIPRKLSETVWTIVGLTDHNRHYINADSDIDLPFLRKPVQKMPLKLGFTDRFTKHYHVTPLYKKGLTGKGQTVGIIALEGARESNIYHFWHHEKVSTRRKRLTVQPILSPLYNTRDSESDSDETTMDAEYAGSVAPDANVKIYLVKNGAPTLTNLIDAYEKAFNDNIVSSTTNSWGLMDSGTVSILRHRRLLTPVYRQLLTFVLAQGAIQGISNFIASGDAGAYKYMVKSVKRNQLLLDRTLDASDFSDTNQLITSVGGTTLPLHLKGSPKESIINKRERAWGTDYLWPFLKKHPIVFQANPGLLNGFVAGSAGGFDHCYSTPAYQLNVPGINTFKAQNFLSALGQPAFSHQVISGVDYGRNYPDVSANADEMTGYWMYQRIKDHPRHAWSDGGGTSVVSPQYAAVTALINSQPGRKRMGFWNPQIYQLAQQADSPFTPLNRTQNNSNLYYVGQPGTIYNQATGLGIPNFEQLAKVYQ